jgi:hypothetical protein
MELITKPVSVDAMLYPTLEPWKPCRMLCTTACQSALPDTASWIFYHYHFSDELTSYCVDEVKLVWGKTWVTYSRIEPTMVADLKKWKE